MRCPKVSVIIPVYAAEKYIARCARSLFGQTLDDMEYIFVDDCTPDSSIDMMNAELTLFPHRVNQVRIIHNKHNLGVAAARSAGMKAATGEFMIHCDPDDWVDEDAYRAMYVKAIANDCDIVRCQFIEIFPKGNIKKSINNFEGSGISAIKTMNISFSLCGILVKSSIIKNNEIYPPEGMSCGEDTCTAVKIFSMAKMVSAVKDVFYNYDHTQNSMSLSKLEFGRRKEQLERVFDILTEWLGKHSGLSDDEINTFINRYKYIIKSPFISSSSCRNVRIWINTWPESNRQYIHDLPHKHLRLLHKLGIFFPPILAVYERYLDFRLNRI